MEFEERLREHFDSLAGREFTPSTEAAQFVQQMMAQHPRQLRDWVMAHAEHLVTEQFKDWDNSIRRRMKREVPKRLFAEAASAFEGTGRPAEFEGVLSLRFPTDGNKRKPLGEMVGHECEFAAAGYGRSGRSALAMEAFLLAVAKEVGDKQVDSVMTEEECGRLMQSFLPPHELHLAAVA